MCQINEETDKQLPWWMYPPCLSESTHSAQRNAPPTNIADAIIDLTHLAGWNTRVITCNPKGARQQKLCENSLIIVFKVKRLQTTDKREHVRSLAHYTRHIN